VTAEDSAATAEDSAATAEGSAATAEGRQTVGRVVCLGVHILDVLGRPVTHIPPGQGRLLLDEIRITAAGTAAGTSVDLAKLGAQVTNLGAIGDDVMADLLLSLLAGYGVDASRVVRKPGQRTSSTILPIRPNGERPALHMPGATSLLELADIDFGVIAEADVLHVGGPDVIGPFGGEPLRQVVEFARAHDVVVTMDLLSTADELAWQRLALLLPYVTYFMPNEDQLANLTGTTDHVEGSRMALDRGAEVVFVSRAAAGATLVTADRQVDVPAFPVELVDTTGCGDAVSAGFITGLLHGWPIEDASWLAMAAASLVASGLGSDAGIVDLAGTLEVLRQGAPESVLGRILAARG
jgi:sugar/nucleoside kinase (ribokinase family)